MIYKVLTVRQHMIFEHEAGPGCKPCHIVFDNVEELHKHYRLTGPPKHPLCPKCGKGFSDEDRLSSVSLFCMA